MPLFDGSGTATGVKSAGASLVGLSTSAGHALMYAVVRDFIVANIISI